MAPPFVSSTIEKMKKKLGRNSEKSTTGRQRRDFGPDEHTYKPDLGFGTSIFVPESRVSYRSSWFSKRSASRSTVSLPSMVPYSGRRGVVAHTCSGPDTASTSSDADRPTTQDGIKSGDLIPRANHAQPSSNQQTGRRSRFTEDLPAESTHNELGRLAPLLGSYSTLPYPSIDQHTPPPLQTYPPQSCCGHSNQS